MRKYYRPVRLCIAIVIAILSVAAFCSNIYPIKIFDMQLTALAQRLLVDFSITALVLAGFLIILTLIFGRIYCSTLCPFGLLQELLMIILRRKVSTTQNYPYKYFLAAICFGALLGGTAFIVRLIDPYTIFGSGMSGAALGIVFFIAITILVWFKGRLFCSNICPVGAVLGLMAKHSLFKIYMEQNKCVSCGLCAKNCPTGSIDFKNKTVNNETCIKCFNCLTGCLRSGVHFGIEPKTEPVFSPSRRSLLVGGTAILVLATAYKTSLELSKTVIQKFKNVILPAGAGNKNDFANRCLNCNLCVQNCPMKIIKKADENYPAVHLDYSDSFCDYDCHKCSEVCPSGAIRKISLIEKQKTQIGIAQLNPDVCVKCGLCVMKCPRQIISREDGEIPVINQNECIGCGACQNTCPVKAITVEAVQRQKLL